MSAALIVTTLLGMTGCAAVLFGVYLLVVALTPAGRGLRRMHDDR